MREDDHRQVIALNGRRDPNLQGLSPLVRTEPDGRDGEDGRQVADMVSSDLGHMWHEASPKAFPFSLAGDEKKCMWNVVPARYMEHCSGYKIASDMLEEKGS
jgi:hypothetical protein